jgi:hypothetical protein
VDSRCQWVWRGLCSAYALAEAFLIQSKCDTTFLVLLNFRPSLTTNLWLNRHRVGHLHSFACECMSLSRNSSIPTN